MTNATVARIISWVNQVGAGRVFIAGGDALVRRGRAWPLAPAGDPRAGGYDFWFVFDGSGTCVTAILDMGDDLHAYTSPAYRRRGFAARALRDVVLPSLRANGKLLQRATYKSAAGAALFESLGGRTTGPDQGEIDLVPFARSVAPADPAEISVERRDDMAVRLRCAAQLLRIVADEYRIAGASDSVGPDALDALASEVDDARTALPNTRLQPPALDEIVKRRG
jgi:GNAT superfamily N-acetyltransferase